MQDEMKALREENAEMKAQLKVLEPPKEEVEKEEDARGRPWWRFWGRS